MTEDGVIRGPAGWQGSSSLHPYLVVDVFTSEPLQGNQLGVFVDGRPFSCRKSVSAKFSSRARRCIPPRQGGDVRVRIFTPGAELPFAGHPVLGAAFVVGQSTGADSVTLETGIGLIPLALEREGDRIVFGRMKQPVAPCEPYAPVAGLLDALGVTASLLPIELYRNGPPHVYVRLASEAAVAALQPDMVALKTLNVAANCFAGRGRSWKTRMFYPAAGVPEDPATGSAAGPLALHLVRHGQIACGDEIEISQGAEIGRPSLLYATVVGAGERIDAVEVGGAALIVAEGRFRVALA